MKKVIISVFICISAVGIILQLPSCEKDKGELPDIYFKTGGGYVSADKSINSGDAVLFGIIATKAEEEGEDVLKTFNIQHTINASTSPINDTTITIPSAQEDSCSFDFIFNPTGASNDTLKYTFSVTNRDGLINSIKLMLMIN